MKLKEILKNKNYKNIQIKTLCPNEALLNDLDYGHFAYMSGKIINTDGFKHSLDDEYENFKEDNGVLTLYKEIKDIHDIDTSKIGVWFNSHENTAPKYQFLLLKLESEPNKIYKARRVSHRDEKNFHVFEIENEEGSIETIDVIEKETYYWCNNLTK